MNRCGQWCNSMADSGFTRFPVLDPSGKIVGMVALGDLLHARTRNLEDSALAKGCCGSACLLDRRGKKKKCL